MQKLLRTALDLEDPTPLLNQVFLGAPTEKQNMITMLYKERQTACDELPPQT